jgi:hypothetical protein
MSGEVSYFSRFFVKFVEIIAAGLASAISGYLLAHFAGLLSSPTPPSHPALTTGQVGPAASGVTAQPTPPVAAATANEHPAPQDAAEPKLAPKASKDAKVLPPRKHPKTDTDVAEKETFRHSPPPSRRRRTPPVATCSRLPPTSGPVR